MILEDLKNTVNDIRTDLKENPKLTAKQIHDFKCKETFWDKHTCRIIASIIADIFGLGTGCFITLLAFFLTK